MDKEKLLIEEHDLMTRPVECFTIYNSSTKMRVTVDKLLIYFPMKQQVKLIFNLVLF